MSMPRSLSTSTAFCDAPAIGNGKDYGNSGVGIILGPGQFNWDIAILKRIRILEDHSIQFRTEFFNAFNHPNFGNPNANISSPGSFGKVSNTLAPILGNDSGGPGDPREIQLALKFYF